jgi:hypothetical protein
MCTSPPVQTPRVELADVFRLHGENYCQSHPLTPEQYKVVHAILNCRTSVLGGHIEQCQQCQAIQYAYHSCRNRHCPKCESFKAAQWLQDRQAELLPVPYFHVVFTLPHSLNNLVLYNKRILYNLLFECAWETLKTLGQDPKRLGGEMAMLSILHTWGQNLSPHNHVHCIVPGGVLKPDGTWKSTNGFLFPVKVLSRFFRGAYVSKLRILYQRQQLKMPNQLTEKLNAYEFDQLLNELMRQEWIVYAKPPFTDPENLLNYLGRYTHKIAISNHRILACDEESVTFKWRDYADHNKEKIMKLKPEEFIRRFLSHVLPDGFMRIRNFGFLANACKANKIPAIQEQLKYVPTDRAEQKDIATRLLELTGKDITRCPYCLQGTLKRIGNIPSKFSNTVFDTS